MMIFFEVLPQSAMMIFFEVLPLCEPNDSIFLTTSMPSTTWPNTTCLPSSHWVLAVQRKNWDPLVLGPALAIDRTPGPVCLRVKLPPWHMKLGMTLWKEDPLNPKPFSPVQRARKFSQVLGTTSARSSMMTLPTGAPSAVTSKKTLTVAIVLWIGWIRVDWREDASVDLLEGGGRVFFDVTAD